MNNTELDLLKYFSSIKRFLSAERWSKVEEAISEGLDRSIVARRILRGKDGVDEVGIFNFVLETYAPPYFDFSDGGRWLSEEDAQTTFLILPNENLTKKELTEGLKSVESPPVETETTKGKETMKTGINLIHAYIELMGESIYSLPSISRSEIAEGKSKTTFKQLARYLKGCGADSRGLRSNFDSFDDLVWYDFESDRIIDSNLDGFTFLLPMPKSFAEGKGEKVLFLNDATNYVQQSSIINGAKEIMQTIKESAVKTKDQVIKTAIGQAGVAGIKSLILTALPMKIGFIGRLLGRHKAVANNSLVVAGIAILANQAAQKFITNEAAKNALQATQDQAVTELLNEYVGIENQIQKTVSKTLDLENSPVTVDQQD